jgi:8-oxo-dGTP pyrophosphatase MutT (NUDIX family)
MLKQFTTSIFIIHKLDGKIKILLIHHKEFDRWMVPGGHIESFENQIEATIREAKEETGLDIQLFSFLHEKNEVNDSEWLLPPEYFFEQLIPPTPKTEEHYHLDFAYLAFANGLDYTFNAQETKDIRWVDLEEALQYNLFDGTRIIVKNIIHNFKSNKKPLFIQSNFIN